MEKLPIRHNLFFAYVISLIITLFMIAASIFGILYPSITYPTNEQLQAFMPNDVVNLVIGVPILLGSMWLTRRGKLIGLLFWPSLASLFFLLILMNLACIGSFVKKSNPARNHLLVFGPMLEGLDRLHRTLRDLSLESAQWREIYAILGALNPAMARLRRYVALLELHSYGIFFEIGTSYSHN